MAGNYQRMKQAVGQTPLPVKPPAPRETPDKRDQEMEKKGRYPDGTIIESEYRNFEWKLKIAVPLVENPLRAMTVEAAIASWWAAEVTGPSIHKLLTVAYRRWLDAGKPGDKSC